MRVILGILLGVCCISMIATMVRAFVLECYVCDSAEDAECATQPGQQINVEECPSADDECVTVIVAGITRRGCLTRLFPNRYCAEPCDRCNTSLCNRNVFPADRLRCYQCVGADCVNVHEKPRLMAPCPVYNEKDRCYTNVIGLQNVHRGCEYTNLTDTCPHVCLKCNYDGCNDELVVHEQSCLECSHTSASPNPECLRRQQPSDAYPDSRCALAISKRCVNKLMLGHAGKCFTYVNSQTGVVQRGCSSTMGFYPTGVVKQCYGDNCNNECLDIECNNCDTSEGALRSLFNCRYGVNLKAQTCPTGIIDCYSCERGSLVTRGCADNTFEQQADEACQLCRNSNGCNRHSVRTCYHCSSLESADCADGIAATTRIEQRNCSAADELCVSTVVKKFNLMYTVRGCASQVPECTVNDPLCARCNGSLCNTEQMSWQIATTFESSLITPLDVRSEGIVLGPLHIFIFVSYMFTFSLAKQYI